MDAPQNANLKIAPDDVSEKLQKKIHQVTLKEQEEDVVARAQRAGVLYIDLRMFPVPQEALALIPREFAVQHQAVCFLFKPDEIHVASSNVDNPALREMLHQLQERHHAQKGYLYLTSQEGMRRVLEQYDRLPVARVVEKGVTISEEDLTKFQATLSSLENLQRELQTASITDIVALVVATALKFDSSDIHIEAEKEKIVFRFRLDGILQDIASVPHEEWKKIISRIKLISNLKINVADAPQDGRFGIRLSGGEIDVRVSTLPTVYGESVVIRILKPMEGIEIEKLGLNEYSLGVLKRAITRPNGMLITTGPTGSGKTTTLYAVLRRLNQPGVKIITLEDPVEYKLEGINQSQIDPTHEFTFAKGLRALLRQDPDIVMVGEIRDLETAETAINAALTGHLMLSTIHTNSASGAIPRFLAMGVKPFLLAPSLRAVMGQRLVRRLCDACKKPAPLDDAMRTTLDKAFSLTAPGFAKPDFSTASFFGPVGCTTCNNTGYKGRMGLYEIFEMTAALAQLIGSTQPDEYAISERAIQDGMITMVQDGVLKALQGVTSLEEVTRVAD